MAMKLSTCPGDRLLGPTIEGCRDSFDFTIKFEQIFLSIVPSAICIVLCLPRISFLLEKPVIIGNVILKRMKLATVAIYAGLQLALLCFACIKASEVQTLIASSALSFVAALCIATISYLEHPRSPRPSFLLSSYFAITALLDSAQVRTLWLASTGSKDQAFAIFATISLAIKLVLVVLESQPKTQWVHWDAKHHSPEETSGVFNLGSFAWLNRLFFVGFRKTLASDDLFPLDQNIATEPLQARLTQQLESRPPGQKHGLARALGKSLFAPLSIPIGPRIALIALQFCQPFIISTLLEYLQHSDKGALHNVGYGLIGATALVYTGIALSGAFYWYYQERAMYMARGMLAGVVYRRLLEAKATDVDDSAVLTLMSADIERVTMGFLSLHEFWANFIQVGLSTWLLFREIGVSAIAPLIVVLCCVASSSVLSKMTGPRQKAWMERIEKRVGHTSNVLRHIKNLKISGLTSLVETSIQSMRVDELKTASRFREVMTISVVIAFVPVCISPVFTFLFASRELGTARIFTAISYVLLMASPLSTLFQMLPGLLAAFTCLIRIQDFLEREPRLDFRKANVTLPLDHTGDQMGRNIGVPDRLPKMKISEARFGWELDKAAIMDIDSEIFTGKLTMVVGPVASGKSTLCKALLGELPVVHGSVTLSGSPCRIGYCDQTPYLLNATIKENIVGFDYFNQARYDEVLEVTMLRPDLASLPLGDQTKVGSNGIALSGGQKQRVSMARALYLQSDLLIFDDVLASLDVGTSEYVFEKVFSPSGLIRQRGATVVLCTHTGRYLPFADHIIALGSDGHVREQGSFAQLNDANGYVHGLGIQDIILETATDGAKTPRDTEHSGRASSNPMTSNLSSEPKQANEPQRMTGDATIYRYYLSRLSRSSILVFLMLGVCWGFLTNFTTVWLKFWSGDVTSANPHFGRGFYLGLYALFQVSALASLLFMCLICFKSMILDSGSRLHEETLQAVFTAPLSFFSKTNTGVMTNLFSQDMNLIDGELPIAFVNLVMQSLSCIGMAAVVATSSPYLVISFPPLAMAIYAIQKFYLRTSRQLRLLDLEAKSPLYTHFIDTVKGIITFRSFGWSDKAITQNDQLLDASQRPAYLLAMIQRWLQFTMQLIVAALAVIVVTLATQLKSHSALTGASLVTLMKFGDALSFLVRVYTGVETSIGAVGRLKAFKEQVTPEDLPGEDVIPPLSWPSRGSIQVTGVSASYYTTHADEDIVQRPSDAENKHQESCSHLALSDINLSISAGQKVAVCGRTGSGKSSLLLLLLRLLDPFPSNSNTITIDDMPIDRVDRHTLRERLIALPQEPVFLPDGTSFQSNLDLRGTSLETECREVLETVGLWDFVEARGGLAAGMNPETLSQGQKQLFSLARALIRRRLRWRNFERARDGQHGAIADGEGGVLLLDEFSSSVDKVTGERMHAIIRREFEAYTTIVISHRLDEVMDFDTVLVMEQGRIVEVGKPKVLAQVEGSMFGELLKTENMRKAEGRN